MKPGHPMWLRLIKDTDALRKDPKFAAFFKMGVNLSISNAQLATGDDAAKALALHTNVHRSEALKASFEPFFQ